MALPVSPHYLAERGAQYHSFAGKPSFYRTQQIELYFRGHTTAEDTVLDFGCNDGLFLASLPAKRRIGVEVNPTARAQIVSDDIEVHADAGSVESGIVDVAISNHCLEHTLTPFEALKEIHRTLKPGGKLVLVLPFDDWRGNGNERWKPDNHDNHLFTWSPMNIGNLLVEAGFVIERSEAFPRAISNRFEPLRHFQPALLLAGRLFAWHKKKAETLTIAVKPM